MVTRRSVLKAVVAGSVITAYSGILPGVKAFAQTGPRKRRSVNNMKFDDPDLETYRDFVGLMRNKPQTELVSWTGFANQHGDANNFKYCPHGDWYFLPWHRGFVEMYEKAAAVLTNNPDFAMPYWDWTTLRQLPGAFTEKTYKGKPNPLYVPGRGDDASMIRNALTGPYALTDALVGPKVIESIYKETVFEAFGTSRNPRQNNLDPKWVPMGGGNQGILERTPHNNIHNNIGAYMPNSNSPRDPIFMMHHGNIDRIWAYWNALGRKNSNDPLWLNMPFTDNYISPDGKFYTKVVKDLQSTSVLGYTYDNLPSKPDNKKVNTLRSQNLTALFNPAQESTLFKIKQSNISAATLAAPLRLSLPLENQILQDVIKPVAENTEGRELVALISDIKISDNVQAIRVFINRETVNLDVPDTDPHYVTTLGFLKHGSDHGLPSAIVNLTEALKNIAKTNSLANDEITVQLLPVPKPGVATTAVSNVLPASIELAVI
ncbi:polyphenol oxidase [Nitrosomonas sp. HPC101]|uniref:tyrosinase family protein n=1 Tax=Nitrosomonas sp. HPC101 TaxID=1658667 RepID=UPI00136F1928|nr:tyrosinase family protein [Nitrosomonas sp. HPC101]MXS85513.1 polyphenol oxidase [Nitrosomonas sp. HPC101]